MIRWQAPIRDDVLRLSNGRDMRLDHPYRYIGPTIVDLHRGMIGTLKRDRGRIDFVYDIDREGRSRHAVFDESRTNALGHLPICDLIEVSTDQG